MAASKKSFAAGLTIWWKDSTSIWLELGKDKASKFISTNKIGKMFLLLIPPPWGEMAYALASRKISDAASNMGPNGLWVKFNALSGYVKARPRNPTNMQKEPTPW